MKKKISSLKVGDKLLITKHDPFYYLHGFKKGDTVVVEATPTSPKEQNRSNGVYIGCNKNEVWLSGSHPTMRMSATAKDLNVLKAKLVE